MLAPLDKAKATSRAHADRILAQQSRAIRTAFINNVALATSPANMRRAGELLAQGNLNAATALVLDRFAGNVANALAQVFVSTANAEVAALGRKLVQKAPTISLSFNQLDPRAVRLMEANRLAYVQG